MQLHVHVQRDLPPVSPGAISFETGAGRDEVLQEEPREDGAVLYEHHGEGFSPESEGALSHFYRDLLLGRALPLTFCTRRVADLDTLVALGLFLHRDWAIHPRMPSLVGQVDLAHRGGDALLAHVDQELADLFHNVRLYFALGIGPRDVGERLPLALGWVKDYLDTGTVSLPVPRPQIEVLDVGSNGFVYARAPQGGDLRDAWLALYRAGHLRGLCVSPTSDQRLHARVQKKSAYLDLDLHRAAQALNTVESVMGEPATWAVLGDLTLVSPATGTRLGAPDLLNILQRV